MAARAPENVWDYPRPPRLEPVADRLRVTLGGAAIADTAAGYRVLETSHPPTYYFPPRDVDWTRLAALPGRTICEWKGEAEYYGLIGAPDPAARAAWCYRDPPPAFRAIADHAAFYASRAVDCFVGKERVRAQDGRFYGGWVTSWIAGDMKGRPGTEFW